MLDKFLDYLKYEKRYSLHTIKAYKTDLEELYDYSELIHNCSSEDLNYQQVRHYIVYLQDRDFSNRTINRKLSSIKRYYKYLLSIEHINTDPTAKISSLKHEKKVMVPYSREEMDNLFNSMEFTDDFEGRRDKLMLSVFYNTGIRQSELIDLKLTSVDFSNSQIKVLGKRNKERIIPVLKELLDEISDYISLRNELESIESGDHLFLTKNGKHLYPSLVYGRINYYLSNVTKKVKKSPHMIRHTFATHMMDAGADLNSIKELLGHTSLVATQVYTHSSIGKLKSIVNNAHPRAKKK